MIATNLKLHQNISFDAYQQLPGYSFSQLKHDGKLFEPSPKMLLGTAVHAYLMDPKAFKGDIRIVKPLAMALKDCIGSLWEYMHMELSVTCDMTHEGFKMPYRGRLDMGILKRIVIDFKIGNRVRHSMNFFEYPVQLTGYCKSIDAPVGFIIAINPEESKPKPDIIPVEFNEEWWEGKILLNGEYDTTRSNNSN